MSQANRLRVFAFPLTNPRPNGKPAIVYYHVKTAPEPPSKNPHLVKRSVDKVVATWNSFSKQDKSSWKVSPSGNLASSLLAHPAGHSSNSTRGENA